MKTGPPFPPWATNDVKCRGEELDPVLWLGQQWAVTLYGLEARDGTYCIERSRLFELEHEHYSWETHMAGKGWVNEADFAEAMDIARRIWPKGSADLLREARDTLAELGRICARQQGQLLMRDAARDAAKLASRLTAAIT